MKENKDYDEVDKLMFEYFDKNKDNIPYSTIMTIEKFSSSKPIQKTKVNVFKKIASIIIAIVSLSASLVIAKEIVTYFFTNSNQGIETAAQNGYLQELDIEYVESNNIAAKINNIIMDDNNLDISFIYKYFEDNVESINFSDVLIKDENDNILYCISDEYDKQYSKERIGEKLFRLNEPKKIDNNTFTESLLITTENNNFPHSEKLNVIATKAHIIKNDKVIKVEGLWTFKFDLSEKLVERKNSTYLISDNDYVSDYDIDLTDTSLDIELHLNTEIKSDIVLQEDNITLVDENNIKYNYNSVSAGNNTEARTSYKSIIKLNYNITKYDKLNTLILTIKINEKTKITLYLNSNN